METNGTDKTSWQIKEPLGACTVWQTDKRRDNVDASVVSIFSQSWVKNHLKPLSSWIDEVKDY